MTMFVLTVVCFAVSVSFIILHILSFFKAQKIKKENEYAQIYFPRTSSIIMLVLSIFNVGLRILDIIEFSEFKDFTRHFSDYCLLIIWGGLSVMYLISLLSANVIITPKYIFNDITYQYTPDMCTYKFTKRNNESGNEEDYLEIYTKGEKPLFSLKVKQFEKTYKIMSENYTKHGESEKNIQINSCLNLCVHALFRQHYLHV